MQVADKIIKDVCGMKVFNKKNNSYYLIFMTVITLTVVFFQNCSKTPYQQSTAVYSKK